jgi:hypothetical protein
MYFVEFLEFLCRLAWVSRIKEVEEKVEEITGIELDEQRLIEVNRKKKL